MPYETFPSYYVPQLLGLMSVFGRSYADLFVFTQRNGCVLYRVEASPALWADLRCGLHAFWHERVLPARAARAAGASDAEVRGAFAPRHDYRRAKGFEEACRAHAATAQPVVFDTPPLAELREEAERQAEEEAARRTDAA
jgi:hypothetical protein